MGYIYICRTHTQTTDFSQDTEHKNENGCNSFKYDSRIPATSRAHGDNDNFRHHHGSDLSNPAGSEYRMSGPRLSLLTLITRGRPSLSPPSVSSHALPLLLSQAPTGPRITHQTRSPGSVTPSHSAASRPEDFTQQRK